MPRPEIKEITFSIDGREVKAPAGAMLVDAAKYGDIEIPVFCYEPKLGQPVGACRMCLVEVEGIPKLQTACSTPVKDGMVVHTQTDKVHEAQRAVVEFLLINHPLDCPVCDKGGECPLQDITYGWGPGTSRFIEPKRHFRKPLELSPLVAIDRERCILCYRCVRFSQELSEDNQLVLLERGAHSYVGTFDGHPYVAPFSGNITELCPVGALTSSTYRFRARPWDIEGAGTVCTMCPAQCNVELTVRDEKVMRVLARENADVDDGWLCDKGRYAFQAFHVDERITTPLVRQGTKLLPASWETALSMAASALAKAGGRAAAIAGGETTNEEAFLAQRFFREGLGSARLISSAWDEPPVSLGAAQATVADLEFAHAVLVLDCDPVDEAPVWDLRIRKGVRRRGVRLAVASARPTALDANAEAVLRFSPGSAEALLVALDAALADDEGNLSGGATAAGAKAADVRALADVLRAGEDVVIVASERTLNGAAGAALASVASRLGLGGREGAGVLIIPAGGANGRGVRESGFAGGNADSLEDANLVYLLHADPLREYPDRARWNKILGSAATIIAHESVMTPTVSEHADIVFPAEVYAEKEGTVTHPDGLVQRVRVAIGHPRAASGEIASGVRATAGVICELAQRAGHDLGVTPGPELSAQVNGGLTLEEIGGNGARRPAGEPPLLEAAQLSVPTTPPGDSGELRVGTWRPLWASKEVDVSPALQFIRPTQIIELSPADAERFDVTEGDLVDVGEHNGNGDDTVHGRTVRGVVRLRAAIPAGSVFLVAGAEDSPANALSAATATIEKVAETLPEPSAEPALVTPSGGDLAPETPAIDVDADQGPSQSNDGGVPG